MSGETGTMNGAIAGEPEDQDFLESSFQVLASIHMLTPQAQAVLDAAMKLSAEDRQLVTERLWAGVDDAAHDQLDAAWEAEIERRVVAIERGEAELIDGEPIMRALREGRMP